MAKRTLELGSVEQAFETMKHDETLRNFFIVDYNTLQTVEQSLLRRCAESKVPAVTASTTESMAKQTLLALGLLVEHEELLQPRAPLIKAWLEMVKDEGEPASTTGATTGFRQLRRGERIGSYEILHEIARG
jgi:hypothetical protein